MVTEAKIMILDGSLHEVNTTYSNFWFKLQIPGYSLASETARFHHSEKSTEFIYNNLS